MPARRLVPFVCAVFVLEAALYSALTPLLPHLARSYSLSRAMAGVLTGAYAAGVIPGAVVAGRFSARSGSRATILAGLIVLGGASVVFGLGGGVAMLVASRAVQGVAAGAVWGATLAWLVAASPDGAHGRRIGIAFGAATFGMVGGPVIGTASLAAGTAPVFATLGACALGLAAWALTLPRAPVGPAERVSLLAPYRDRAMLAQVWLVTLQALPVGLIGVLVPLRMRDLGGSQASIAATFLVSAALGGAISAFAGRVADRRGNAPPIRVGLVLAVPCLLALPLPGSTVVIAVLTVAFLAACRTTSLVPTVAQLSSDGTRRGVGAVVPAAILTASSIGETLGSAGGAGLAQATSELTPFAVLAGLYAASLLVAVRPGLRARGR